MPPQRHDQQQRSQTGSDTPTLFFCSSPCPTMATASADAPSEKLALGIQNQFQASESEFWKQRARASLQFGWRAIAIASNGWQQCVATPFGALLIAP
jgi:hypothetical protein